MLREVLRRGAGQAGGGRRVQGSDDQPARAGEGRPGQPADGSQPGQPQGGRARRLPATLAGLAGRHRLFCVALGLGVVPRIVAMLGYQPAILFRLDTYDYLWDAVHVRPNPVNPSGYSLLLLVLRPFHSLALIAGIQQLAGLGIAVAVYAVLRHWGVRSWIATLAAAPVLFSPAQLLLEQLVMADIVALLLMVSAFAVLLTRDAPSARRVAVAGLLMGVSVLVRPTALPLIPAMAVYLLCRRASWRRVGAVLAGGAVPIVVYLAWFASVYGSFNLTNSNGLFLWTRTMSFANCAVIKPPADLQALCPNRQPGYLNQQVAANRPLPKRYLWDHLAWQWQPPTPGLVPDTSLAMAAADARAGAGHRGVHQGQQRPGAALRDPGDHRPAGGLPACRRQRYAARLRQRPAALVPGHAGILRPWQGQRRLRAGRGARLSRQYLRDRPPSGLPLRLPAAAAIRPADELLPAGDRVPRPAVRADPRARAGRDHHPPAAERCRRVAVVLGRDLHRAADRRARVPLPLCRPGYPAGVHGGRARVPRPVPRHPRRRGGHRRRDH